MIAACSHISYAGNTHNNHKIASLQRASRNHVRFKATASFTFNRYDIGVGVSSFELDFWGRVKNLSEAGRASYLASVATQRAFYLSLIADTATGTVAMLSARLVAVTMISSMPP